MCPREEKEPKRKKKQPKKPKGYHFSNQHLSEMEDEENIKNSTSIVDHNPLEILVGVEDGRTMVQSSNTNKENKLQFKCNRMRRFP